MFATAAPATTEPGLPWGRIAQVLALIFSLYLVERAVRQVGQDLHALRVEALEQALHDANTRIDGMLQLSVRPS